MNIPIRAFHPVIAHSPSSIAGGQGWDDAVVKRLSEVVAPDTVVTTNGRDCQAALRALKVERPFLVFPAWFADPVLPKGIAYFAEHGFPPAGHMRVDPGPANGRMSLHATSILKGMAFEQDVEHL